MEDQAGPVRDASAVSDNTAAVVLENERGNYDDYGHMHSNLWSLVYYDYCR